MMFLSHTQKKRRFSEIHISKSNIFTILLLILTIISLYLINFLVNPTFAQSATDDHDYYNVARSQGVFQFLYSQYMTWSGRLSALFMVVMSSRTGDVLYRITNPLFLLISAYSMARYLSAKVSLKTLLFFLLAFGLLNEYVINGSIYWFTGSYFYAVPVSMGLFAMIPYADSYLRGKNHMSIACSVLSAAAGLIAVLANEQAAVVIVGAVIFFHIGKLLKKDKISVPFYILSALFIAGTVVILICPGSASRWNIELKWFPDFNTLSLVSHLKVGFCWFFDSVVNAMVLLVIALSCIPLLNYRKYVGKYKIIASLFSLQFITFIVSLLFDGKIQSTLIPFRLTNFSVFMTYYKTPLSVILNTVSVKHLTLSLFPYIFWAVYLVFLVALICKASEKPVFTFLLFMAGFTTLFMMFFSPTIFASGLRVLYVCSIIFIIIIGYSAKKMNLIENKKCLILLAILFAVNYGIVGLNCLNYL